MVLIIDVGLFGGGWCLSKISPPCDKQHKILERLHTRFSLVNALCLNFFFTAESFQLKCAEESEIVIEGPKIVLRMRYDVCPTCLLVVDF
jgi:hypothetical protein